MWPYLWRFLILRISRICDPWLHAIEADRFPTAVWELLRARLYFLFSTTDLCRSSVQEVILQWFFSHWPKSDLGWLVSRNPFHGFIVSRDCCYVGHSLSFVSVSVLWCQFPAQPLSEDHLVHYSCIWMLSMLCDPVMIPGVITWESSSLSAIPDCL